MYAVGRNHLEATRTVLDRSASTTQSEEISATLITAALIGDTPGAEELLERGAQVNSRDHNGRTPLIEAAFGGHQQTVALLLERGAIVNARDADGWTALMEAASKGRTEMCRLLLSYGADPMAIGNNGWTALRLAARGNGKLITLLLKAQSATCFRR